MFFFIADTHFGHEKIIEMCGRPFDSVEEMNEFMIDAWNVRVRGNDTVYVLGDMFFRCADPEAILKRLKGKKRLLLGNHDGSWTGKVDIGHYFESVDTMLETTDGHRALTLCHYPLFTWKHAKKSYMIHGHIHNATETDYWPILCTRDRVLNAGVEINGFRPVTIEELQDNNLKWKKEHGLEI